MSKTFTRKEILEDNTLNSILNIIKKNYKTPQHTVDNLLNQKHIKDICETTEHFAIIKVKKEPIYLSYETYTWINIENTISFPTRFNNITYYDNELEFEIARKKGLFKTESSSIPVQILN